MHSSMSVYLTRPAQKSPSKLRCLLSTFHQSGGEVSQCGPPTSNQIRRGCRPGREDKRRAILTEPTGASACPPFCRQGWSPSFVAPSLSLREEEGGTHSASPSTQVPKYPYPRYYAHALIHSGSNSKHPYCAPRLWGPISSTANIDCW